MSDAPDTPYCYRHPRPALTADVVLLRVASGVGGRAASRDACEILLIQRGHPPYSGHWALPGGFVEQGESPLEAAVREAQEETGLALVGLQEVGAFGEPGRDPRGWVVSVAYAGWQPDAAGGQAGDDAAELRWWPLDELPPLAFDHAHIIESALMRLGVSEGGSGGD